MNRARIPATPPAAVTNIRRIDRHITTAHAYITGMIPYVHTHTVDPQRLGHDIPVRARKGVHNAVEALQGDHFKGLWVCGL